MNKIAILLSTYNGDKYVRKQIESIYQQSYRNFELYVRDDGSKKAFVEELRNLQKEFGFVLIEGENLGFLDSFMTLLESVTDADLYAFSDQDDIWLKDKLEAANAWFEQNQDESIPILYHSAYEIIDNDEKKIGDFLFSNEKYDFRRSITENHYSGFSMVINQHMRKLMLDCEWKQIGYHDWWAAMIAQGLGKGYFDDRVYALHRAHGDNVTTFNMKTRVRWLMDTLKQESDVHKRSMEFKRCFYDMLSEEDRKVLDLFCMTRYDLGKALRKSLSLKRWRPLLSSELVYRFLMLIGKM